MGEGIRGAGRNDNRRTRHPGLLDSISLIFCFRVMTAHEVYVVVPLEYGYVSAKRLGILRAEPRARMIEGRTTVQDPSLSQRPAAELWDMISLEKGRGE
jgi:hypothetical protein